MTCSASFFCILPPAVQRAQAQLKSIEIVAHAVAVRVGIAVGVAVAGLAHAARGAALARQGGCGAGRRRNLFIEVGVVACIVA